MLSAPNATLICLSRGVTTTQEVIHMQSMICLPERNSIATMARKPHNAEDANADDADDAVAKIRQGLFK
jgi:hypothetical protein